MILTFPIARNAFLSSLMILALAGVSGRSLAQSAPTLESVMGTESFRATGLQKLSEAEQEELVRWLQSRGIGTDQVSGTSGEAVDDEASEALRSSLREAQRVREQLAAEREQLAAEVAAARAAAEKAREERGAAMAAAEEAETRRETAERAASEKDQDEFESRLKKPFSGWSGKTLFYLENGQVWRQRLRDRYVHREGDLPRIRISRNVMGYYEMELLDYGRKVGVSRVRGK